MSKTMKWIFLCVGSFLLMVLIFFFWLYSYSAENLRETIERATQKQVAHAAYLLKSDIEKTELSTFSVLSDSRIRFIQENSLIDQGAPDYVEKNSTARSLLVDRVQNDETLASLSAYWLKSGALISSYDTVFEAVEFYETIPKNGWFVNGNRLFFSAAYPYSFLKSAQHQEPQYFVTAEFSRYHLEEVRDLISNTENSRNLLLFPDFTSISQMTDTDSAALEQIVADGGTQGTEKRGEFRLSGEKFLYFVETDKKSGIKLMTYLPVSNLLEPVQRVAKITVFGIFLILGSALLFLLLFYKSIVQQLNLLTAKFKQVENGDLETSIDKRPGNEFGYVFEQFNQMVVGSRHLLNSLLKEQASRNQAEIKQLQFQINPHFLYNSLGYLVAVSHDQEAVRTMSAHLADYYQYSTRVSQETTLGKELDFAENYLEIMLLRKDLEYLIDVAPELREEPILPILIQPLIENAIQHGIEGKIGAHWVCVSVEKTATALKVSVEDDGYGMNETKIKQLLDALSRSERGEGVSIGLWNVNQRLINRYGKGARLQFTGNELGGLTVFFYRPDNTD